MYFPPQITVYIRDTILYAIISTGIDAGFPGSFNQGFQIITGIFLKIRRHINNQVAVYQLFQILLTHTTSGIVPDATAALNFCVAISELDATQR